MPPPRGISLATLQPHPCPYLPGRQARNRAFLANDISAELYHELMDAGFRRSGRLVYQPVCSGCRACQPVRVPIDSFVPSKSQRRAWRKNGDLIVEVGMPRATAEKFDLYRRYLAGRHDADAAQTPEDFLRFLYDSPVQTLEFTYRLPSTSSPASPATFGVDGSAGGALVGVGICDVCAGRSLSSVYFYFDPAYARRSPGIFSALREIDFARRHKIPHYYMGYFVEGCAAMSYKIQYRPNQLLHPDGGWRAQIPLPREVEIGL